MHPDRCGKPVVRCRPATAQCGSVNAATGRSLARSQPSTAIDTTSTCNQQIIHHNRLPVWQAQHRGCSRFAAPRCR